MAKAKKIKKSAKLKKRWYPIMAPKIFNNQIVGETLIADPSSAVGRIVPVNLMNLTRDMRKQNITIKFIINSITGERASTEVIGFEMSPSSIKRMVRRDKNKIDQSLVAETSDNKKIRLKPIMITNKITKLSVMSALRKKNEELLKKTVKNMNYENLIQELVNHKLQSTLKKQLNKIYPLRVCEIRSIEMEKEKKHVEEKPKAIKKIEKKPKKEKLEEKSAVEKTSSEESAKAEVSEESAKAESNEKPAKAEVPAPKEEANVSGKKKKE